MKRIAALKLAVITWVWKRTPNCAEMSRLASAALEEPLPWRLRLKVRLHFFICVWCRRYARHLQWLHTHAHQADESVTQSVRHSLPQEAKSRIVRRLRGAEMESVIDPSQGANRPR